MLSQSYTATLATLADPIVKACLGNGGQTYWGASLGAPSDEVTALEVFLMCATHQIAAAWLSTVRRAGQQMTMTTVLTHKSPMAHYGPLSLPCRHTGKLPSPNASNNFRCELGDLLVVMEAPHPTGGVARQAGLLQGKLTKGAHRRFSLKKPELKQHHLLTCWPNFHFKKSTKFNTGPRDLRNLPRGAACYGVIDLQSNVWTVHEPQTNGNDLIGPGETLGEWLAELATRKDGAPADWPVSATASSVPPVPKDWAPLVEELLTITARKAATITALKNANAQAVRRPRGYDHLIRFVDATDLQTVETQYRIDAQGQLEEMSGGGGEGPRFGRRRRRRPFGVLHIRFDPIEG